MNRAGTEWGVVRLADGDSPYLVAKQDNNGTTFVISGIELRWHADIIAQATQVRPRRIGATPHPRAARHPARPISQPPPDHQPARRSSLLTAGAIGGGGDT
jgi:hypothetical protein